MRSDGTKQPQDQAPACSSHEGREACDGANKQQGLHHPQRGHSHPVSLAHACSPMQHARTPQSQQLRHAESAARHARQQGARGMEFQGSCPQGARICCLCACEDSLGKCARSLDARACRRQSGHVFAQFGRACMPLEVPLARRVDSATETAQACDCAHLCPSSPPAWLQGQAREGAPGGVPVDAAAGVRPGAHVPAPREADHLLGA